MIGSLVINIQNIFGNTIGRGSRKLLRGYSKDILEYLFRIYYKAIIGIQIMHFLFIISQNLSSTVQVLTTVRERQSTNSIERTSHWFYFNVLEMCAVRRDQETSTAQRKPLKLLWHLLLLLLLACSSGEVHDDADDDFCGSFSTTTITIRHSAASVQGCIQWLTETRFENL